MKFKERIGKVIDWLYFSKYERELLAHIDVLMAQNKYLEQQLKQQKKRSYYKQKSTASKKNAK